jgi:hypothetical protein
MTASSAGYFFLGQAISRQRITANVAIASFQKCSIAGTILVVYGIASCCLHGLGSQWCPRPPSPLFTVRLSHGECMVLLLVCALVPLTFRGLVFSLVTACTVACSMPRKNHEPRYYEHQNTTSVSCDLSLSGSASISNCYSIS